MAHPSVFIAENSSRLSRSVDELRSAVRNGHSRDLWDLILDRSERDVAEPPIVPGSVFPGRDPAQAAWENRDYTVCDAAGKRVKRAAFAAVITGEHRFVDEALRQSEALFDERKWPVWRDKSHPRTPADLRTGMLARELALAYDWLHPYLSHADRSDFVSGLDRCGVQPFLASVDMNAWWLSSNHNWTTCIVGGLGVAGLALCADHEASSRLIEIAHRLMAEYIDHAYGDSGEFNESVGYASATILPMVFFAARDSATGGEVDYLSDSVVRDALIWYLYFVVPPGRITAFGDAHLDAPPESSMFALGARVWRDGIFQSFYLNHRKLTPRSDLVLDLLWYDPSVEPSSPDGKLALGRAYTAHGGCISSRSKWDYESCDSVVCAKSRIELHHQHHDAGNLIIDGYGERLISDPGSPSEYPEDFFGPDRYRYYNASSRGHNVITIDSREMTEAQGRLVSSSFSDRAARWMIDLTACYDSVSDVSRSVVHFLPRVVVVLDTVDAVDEHEVRIRWHTATTPEIRDDGSFVVASGDALLVGHVEALEGVANPSVRGILGTHSYAPGYSHGRSGALLESRKEPYIDVTARGKRCTFLSVFAVFQSGSHGSGDVPSWRFGTDTAAGPGTYHIDLPEGTVTVTPFRDILVDIS